MSKSLVKPVLASQKQATENSWDIRLMCDDDSLVTVNLHPGDEHAFVAQRIIFTVAQTQDDLRVTLAIGGRPLNRARLEGGAFFTRWAPEEQDASLDTQCPQWAKDAVREAIPAEFHHHLDKP
jgi:hypothetical protein